MGHIAKALPKFKKTTKKKVAKKKVAKKKATKTAKKKAVKKKAVKKVEVKKVEVKKVEVTKPKRGRGRPKGSKNKTTKKKVVMLDDKPKRGRGRPKGSKNKRDSKNRKKLTPKQLREQIRKDLRGVNVGKILGYCPKCDNIISSKEMVSMRTILCNRCEKKHTIKSLREEPAWKKRRQMLDGLSKKEYLEDTVGADHHDMPANVPEEEIKPEDIPSS
jgi:hypothetical protein